MNRRYLTAIGFTVVVALALVVRALVFLHPTPGDGARKLHVRFQNVDKIAAGSRVTFAGKPVGEVVRVTLLSESFDERSSRPIYPYEVLLAIDSSVKVYQSDVISVQTAGLMGEHFISITPKSAPDGETLYLVGPTDIVFARASGSAEETLQEITSVAKKADQTMEAMISLINRNQEGIYQTTESIRQASLELQTLLSTLNQGRFGENLVEMSQKSIACLDKIDRVSSLVTTIAAGKGTFGKLMNDPHLYDSLLQCSVQTNQMIADINTYGVLFHTNRDWQRDMRRRADEMVAVAAPSEEEIHRERFVKITQAVSELRQTLTIAKRALGDCTLTESQEASKSLADVQTQIDSLQVAIEELPLETVSEVSNEE